MSSTASAPLSYPRQSLGWYRVRFNTATAAANLLAGMTDEPDRLVPVDIQTVAATGLSALLDVLRLCRGVGEHSTQPPDWAATLPGNVRQYGQIADLPAVVLAAGLVLVSARPEAGDMSSGIASAVIPMAEGALEAHQPGVRPASTAAVGGSLPIAQALDLAERVAALPRLSAKALYNLACTFAVAARLDSGEPDLSTARWYYRRAVALSPALAAAAATDPTLVGVVPQTETVAASPEVIESD